MEVDKIKINYIKDCLCKGQTVGEIQEKLKMSEHGIMHLLRMYPSFFADLKFKYNKGV